MGVQGSGKSTIGALLAERLGVPFVDGDDLHSERNKQLMAAGHALTDAERMPWLHAVGERLAERRRGRDGLLRAQAQLPRPAARARADDDHGVRARRHGH